MCLLGSLLMGIHDIQVAQAAQSITRFKIKIESVPIVPHLIMK